MGDCPRARNLFGGCKFSPRYDISAPASWVGDYQGPAAGLVLVAEASKAQTYVRDVCERCGKTIERGQ
jgi:hypothetical protein